MTIFSSELNTWFESRILDEIPLNVAIIDKEYRIVYANERFRKQFGEWANRKCYELFKTHPYPCPDCSVIQIFEDGVSRNFEEVIGHRNYFEVHTIPATNLQGETTHVIMLSENITDIRNRQLECEIYFDKAPSYIAVLDRDFNIVRANEKLVEAFGESHGRKCYQMYKRRNKVCENCPAALSFSDGYEHTETHVGMSADGKETHYIVTTTPLIKGYTECKFVVEILTDITQIKILEKEKLDAERLAAVGQTVAGLAHSVKNILMGVEGGMYMVSSGIEKDDKKRIHKGWAMLQRNITKVSSMVKDFLSFAKGRMPVVRLIDPNKPIDEIIELYSETAKSLNVNLIIKDRSDLPKTYLDPDGIHTCLTNLVSNAIDACQLSTDEVNTVSIRAGIINEDLVYEVADDGVGMDYDIQKKVFTTFFTTKGGKGTGLGLLTTYKIVHEHGGKILVESQKGKGAVFKIVLPLKKLNELSQ